MKSILLVGAGGHCISCIDVIETVGEYEIRGVVQPSVSSEKIMGYSAIGSDADLPELLKSSNWALVTVGQIKCPDIRVRLFYLLKHLGARLPVIVSPQSYLSKHSLIGEGSIVMHRAVVNAGVKIGKNCIVNSQALLEHGVVVQDHCHISTGVLLNGNVTIGKGSFVGSGTVIKEGVSIGENAVIGAGQVVLRDVVCGTVIKYER